MDDLLKKLNLLVKTTLADVVDEARQLVMTRGQGDSASVPTPAPAHDQVAPLRKRIDESLQFEQQIRNRIHDLEAQIQEWDQKADARLLEGDESGAQYAINQMKQAEQHLALAESDLAEHQRIAAELMSSVNDLEAALASQSAEDASTSPKNPVERFNDILADMREKVNQMGDRIASQTETPSPQPVTSASRPEAATTDTEEDLAKRRKRLSKPE
jgi:ElaB/YqjD/DUF883 family membrane-anchored ribosome-binding protein